MHKHRQAKAKILRGWMFRGLLSLIMLVVAASQVTAQSSSVIWSPPENLSNTPESSVNPAIVADGFGNVHVFWSEDASLDAARNPDLASSGNVIYYTRWDGKSWMEPVDVLYVPEDFMADQMSVTVDQNGNLHIVWTGITNIYYSQAPVARAGSAQAWQQPVVISGNSARSSLESSVAVDDQGQVHVVYATRNDDPGVYHVESADGKLWSEPQKLSEPFDSLETSLSRVKIIADKQGRLHTVWQTSEIGGYGQAIYYTRSIDHGQTWAAPQQMDYRAPGDFDVSWPYLMEARDSELHLIYTGGKSVGARGRYERVSHDGGETWSQPQHIIPEMVGINGYVIPVIDGAGQLHLIINMRPVATQKVGIYYSSWTGDGWSPVVPLAIDTSAAESAHYAAAAVMHGNEIHVVWNQIHLGEIWHLRGAIQNVAPVPVVPVPTSSSVPQEAATASDVAVLPASRIVAKVNPLPPAIVSTSANNSPLIPAVIAALVVVAVIAVARYVRRSRHSS
jgi:hypothetical protein